jgi:hypothetical protein
MLNVSDFINLGTPLCRIARSIFVSQDSWLVKNQNQIYRLKCVLFASVLSPGAKNGRIAGIR